MKVLFIDNCVDGHHLEYMSSLANSYEHESVMILPKKVSLPAHIHQYIFQEDIESKNPLGYILLISYVKKIAREENVDVIHFLNYDPLVKYFGVLLRALKKYRIILTFHHYRYSKLHDFARKKIYRNCSYGIVHTKHLQEYSLKKGIKNCVHIEYPVFKDYLSIDRNESRLFWSVPEDETKVLLTLGGTRYNKGLDILLNALKDVKDPFYLIIAGKEEHFNRDYIEAQIASYKDRVNLHLAYLTDQEVQTAIVASDYVVLPYRKEFDGASGPLGEGVIAGKCIIGPEHGSLGDIITSNHLGYVFEAENPKSLYSIVRRALRTEFEADESYRQYMNSIQLDTFLRRYELLYKEQNKRGNTHEQEGSSNWWK